MDVISKEGPLFLQGVKFGKVRLFIENDHLTLAQGGNCVALILLINYFNSSISTTIIFDACVLFEVNWGNNLYAFYITYINSIVYSLLLECEVSQAVVMG